MSGIEITQGGQGEGQAAGGQPGAPGGAVAGVGGAATSVGGAGGATGVVGGAGGAVGGAGGTSALATGQASVGPQTASVGQASATGSQASATAGQDPQGEVALDTTSLEGDKTGLAKADRLRMTQSSDALAEILNTPQGKTITTGVITAIVVALLIFFAITPAISSINTQTEKNSQLTERIQKMDTKLASLVALQNKEQANVEPLTTFKDYVGDYHSQGEIYNELLELANKTGFEFKSLNYSALDGQVKDYEEYALSDKARFQLVRFAVVGDIDKLDSILSEIESQKRIYDVEEILVSVIDDESSDLQIEFSIRTIIWGYEDEAIV